MRGGGGEIQGPCPVPLRGRGGAREAEVEGVGDGERGEIGAVAQSEGHCAGGGGEYADCEADRTATRFRKRGGCPGSGGGFARKARREGTCDLGDEGR